MSSSVQLIALEDQVCFSYFWITENSMTVLQKQQQLIQQISTIKDENILTMLEEELSYHLHTKGDITDDLTPYELNELITLASEPTDKDTISLEEYRKATEKWRTKS